MGFRVDPPFGVNWPPLRTLRHLAALIEHRTGHKVRVGSVVREQKRFDGDCLSRTEEYEVMTEHCLTNESAGFEVVYAWLSGFENGIHEFLWKASKK